MIAVSSSTMIHGVSHINPNGHAGIPLFTRHGSEFYKRKLKLFEVAKKNSKLPEYKQFLFNVREEVTKAISHLLLDDDMIKKYKMNDEDKEGWNDYLELSDEYSVLTYFLKK